MHFNILHDLLSPLMWSKAKATKTVTDWQQRVGAIQCGKTASKSLEPQELEMLK